MESPLPYHISYNVDGEPVHTTGAPLQQVIQTVRELRAMGYDPVVTTEDGSVVNVSEPALRGDEVQETAGPAQRSSALSHLTDKDYIEKSNNAHVRLGTLRKQVEGHLANSHSQISGDALHGLLQRMSEISGELTALDEQYWASRNSSTSSTI